MFGFNCRRQSSALLLLSSQVVTSVILLCLHAVLSWVAGVLSGVPVGVVSVSACRGLHHEQAGLPLLRGCFDTCWLQSGKGYSSIGMRGPALLLCEHAVGSDRLL